MRAEWLQRTGTQLAWMLSLGQICNVQRKEITVCTSSGPIYELVFIRYHLGEDECFLVAIIASLGGVETLRKKKQRNNDVKGKLTQIATVFT